MKDIESIKAVRQLLEPSTLEANIALCNDVTDFIIEHSVEDSCNVAEEKAYERLEMLYCLQDLRNIFINILKSNKHE